jgi:hypothetical protein
MTTASKNDLFHLGIVLSDYNGYWMDTAGAVYSTRKSDTPTLMTGSNTRSGRYYTMNGRSVCESVLLNLTISSAGWRGFLEARKTKPADTKPAGQSSDSKWAHDTRHGLAEKGWVVATVNKCSGNLVFGSKPKIHLTEASVKAELERLATVFKGDTFVSLKITHEVVANGISWK